MICGRSNLATHLGFGFGPAQPRDLALPRRHYSYPARQAPLARRAHLVEAGRGGRRWRVPHKLQEPRSLPNSADDGQTMCNGAQNKLTSDRPTRLHRIPFQDGVYYVTYE